MLRPERMSRVSVTGSRPVMGEVIETVHDLNLVHLEDYDGSWEGFDNGDPVEGAESASDKLVTVRSLESILEIDPEDAGPTRVVTDEAIETRLEDVRTQVNDLDDRRNDLEDELREVDESLDSMAPFEALELDLDLYAGYEAVEVAVGEADQEAVEAALSSDDAIAAFETFAADGWVAIFAHPAGASAVDAGGLDVDALDGAGEEDDESDAADTAGADGGALADALVGVDFAAIEVPDAEGTPAGHVAELEHRRQQIESRLSTVEDELEDLKLDVAGFLLAAEEKLAIDLQKSEAPLQFATTERSFVAEGWLPTDRYGDLAAALEDAVGGHVEVEEVERAVYDRHGAPAGHEPVEGGHGAGEEVAADGGEARADDGEEVAADGGEEVAADGDGARAGGGAATAAGAAAAAGSGDDAVATDDGDARADGGQVTMGSDEPPIVLDNPGPVRPFQLLTEAVGRPNYSELDPTVVLFLTFPLMFGFMIGDVGYGAIYTGIGYWVYSNFDSKTFENFGFVAMAAGVSTVVFGALYGEIFGLHLVTQYVWEPLLGHPPIEKGLSPATVHWAEAWFVVTALFGIVHLNVGWTFEFIEDYDLHGLREAVVETGSWLLALNGLWIFIFSRLFYDPGPKPDLLFTAFDTGETAAFELGFAGLPEWTGWLGIAMLLVGAGLLAVGPTHELIEIHQVLAHTLSYLRIGAVLLAKAGMAFAVNLLFFGAYQTTDGEFHFMLSHGREYVLEHHPEATIMFGGMLHGGVAAAGFGVLVLLVGHLVVLLLGITSAGIQSIRLEYFEFFSKFYDGGGTTYRPFGRERTYTTED